MRTHERTMSVFARDPSGTPVAPPPAQRHRGVDLLLVAATEADVAQHLLAEARSKYQRGPTPDNKKRLLEAAANALDKEVKFDELWEEVSKDWFGARAP